MLSHDGVVEANNVMTDVSPLDEYTGTTRNDHAVYARQWLVDNGYNNFEVVIATDSQLFLDYDRTTLPPEFGTAMNILKQTLNVEEDLPYELSTSKSGNLHVIVELPYYMPIARRIAWQAAFGSDPKREALHLLSLSKHELNPILLYNKKKPQKLLSEGETNG